MDPKQHIGRKVLVTVDNWFYAPDGRQYQAVFGVLHAVKTAEDTLGIRPNGKSSNWYMEVGNVTIAGCQIHYVVQTDAVNLEPIEDVLTHEGTYRTSIRRTNIYHATGGSDVPQTT
jgi:hypothetical protein